MNKLSVLPALGEMQMKIITKYHLTTARMVFIQSRKITNADNDGEQREPLDTVGGNKNLYNYYAEQPVDFQNLKIYVP